MLLLLLYFMIHQMISFVHHFQCTQRQISYTSGIEITNNQTAFDRCACGNGNDLEFYTEILDDKKSLHNLLEAMIIDSDYTGDTKSWHYNTTAMLFSLFDVMLHR